MGWEREGHLSTCDDSISVLTHRAGRGEQASGIGGNTKINKYSRAGLCVGNVFGNASDGKTTTGEIFFKLGENISRIFRVFVTSLKATLGTIRVRVRLCSRPRQSTAIAFTVPTRSRRHDVRSDAGVVPKQRNDTCPVTKERNGGGCSGYPAVAARRRECVVSGALRRDGKGSNLIKLVTGDNVIRAFHGFYRSFMTYSYLGRTRARAQTPRTHVPSLKIQEKKKRTAVSSLTGTALDFGIFGRSVVLLYYFRTPSPPTTRRPWRVDEQTLGSRVVFAYVRATNDGDGR